MGAPLVNAGGREDAGAVYVFSGADGTLLFRFDGEAQGHMLGNSVSTTGDLNQDGVPDFIAGAPGAGSAYVFSGADGRVLFKLGQESPHARMGESVSTAGDVNRDGIPDVIVGAPGANTAFVFSGADGSVLFRLGGEPEFGDLGWSVSAAGDVNEDGVPDFIVGAPGALTGVFNGNAYVFSGADQKVLFQFVGEGSWDLLGISVSTAGDMNGDGVPDFIVGAPGTDPDGRTDAGSAYLFSGADGTVLFRFDGEELGDGVGLSVVTAGDVNGDGVPDLILGAPYAAPFPYPSGVFPFGRVYVVSGADGVVLFRFDGEVSGDGLSLLLGM